MKQIKTLFVRRVIKYYNIAALLAIIAFISGFYITGITLSAISLFGSIQDGVLIRLHGKGHYL